MNTYHSVKLAYLVSQYPAVSHTFILREIAQLRTLGFTIHTASINRPDRKSERLTEEESKEGKTTYYVKAGGISIACLDMLKTVFTNPFGFIKGAWFALRLGGADLGKILWGFFYFIEAMMVVQWMKRIGCNHLHVHFANPASTVAMIVSRMTAYTFSMTVHGPDVFYDVKSNYLKEKLLSAKMTICISHYACSQLMRLCPYDTWNKLIVCHLGINPEHYRPPSPRHRSEAVRLLCVGRLVAAKGQHLLLLAVEQLLKEGHSVKLELVGDGEDRQSLERQSVDLGISNHVVFRGALNEDETFQALQNADIFVLPSFSEGLPVSLMEAMAMEIPCVTTQITGIPELIHNGIEGILVKPSSVSELTKGIAQLIKNQDLQVQMGKKGRSRILQEYHLEKNCRQLADIFVNCLNNAINTRSGKS